LKEPSKYTLGKESIPLDISVKPKLIVLGLPKSGKSTLCKTLSKKIGVIHLKISKIIE
jgi:ABC-type proline/glycine betaine transport system ATPase subunit